MANIEQVREKVVESLSDLPSDKVKEVLNFVEYLKIRESRDFIETGGRKRLWKRGKKETILFPSMSFGRSIND